MNFLTNFSEKNLLLNWFSNSGFNQSHSVNNHIHSPYSFSAFEKLEQAFEMAVEEGISVLGINDFFVTDGYAPFHDLAIKNNVFPLFNIEFIGLLKKEQKEGIRVNDPNNPGRTYFSGKGLDFPVRLPTLDNIELQILKLESQKQIVQMIEKLNTHLKSLDSSISLDYDTLKAAYAMDLVRERHIARALRIELTNTYTDSSALKDFLTKLYSGKESKADLNNAASFEDEIRGMLLKAGGKAFVEEDERAFLEIKDIIRKIVHAGGIPTYPVLLDDAKGNITEFEKDFEKLYKRLTGMGIYSVELIPGRNSQEQLEAFVEYFHGKNFVISFGTEHNSPQLIPLTVTTRGNTPLSKRMHAIGYEGVCVIAAHQYLRSKNQEGFIDNKGKAKVEEKDDFVLLGKAIIEKFLIEV